MDFNQSAYKGPQAAASEPRSAASYEAANIQIQVPLSQSTTQQGYWDPVSSGHYKDHGSNAQNVESVNPNGLQSHDLPIPPNAPSYPQSTPTPATHENHELVGTSYVHHQDAEDAEPDIDYSLLLVNLAEDYFTAAYQSSVRSDDHGAFCKMIATGLGCLEIALRVRGWGPCVALKKC